MQLSPYQLAVNEHFSQMGGHSAVVSVAGSGKTTTALGAIECLPAGTMTLLGAYNVSIRDEFKKKGTERGLKGVTYANFNGFGWGICLKNLRHKPELDKEKTSKLFEFQIYRPDYDDEADMSRFVQWRNPAEKLVSLFKALSIHTLDEAAHRIGDIIDHYNINAPEEQAFESAVLDTFRASLDHQAHYDFDDQKYMPIHLGMPIPQFDQLVVDEFQDVCPVEWDLMRGACTYGQFCAIGDPDQCIYGFKGATPEVFANYIRDWRAKELPLSICYRCPKAVIREAKLIVPRIEWAEGADEGCVDSPTRRQFMERVKNKDFVLCRTTDELVSTQIEFTEMGRRSKVRGREFGTMLEFIIKRVSKNDKLMQIKEFTTALIDYQIERSAQLTRLRRESELANLEDRCRSIRALSTNAHRVEDIYKRLEDVFSDKPHDGIDLMTVHKSKGLQANSVWILRPDLLPHPRSTEREWMLEEERRLKYVAITRAQKELHWVQK